MNDFLIGLAVPAILLVAGFFLKDKKLEAFWMKLGQSASFFMRARFGIKAWEKIEGFLQRKIKVCFNGFMKGLDSDDQSQSLAR